MIQREEGGTGGPDSQKLQIVVLDWEKSGWCPSYWEYTLAVCALRWNNDWCLWLEKALEQFAAKAACLQTIRLELWS